MKNDKKVTTKEATNVDLNLDSKAYKNPLSETAKNLAKSVTTDNTLSKFISSAKQDNERLLKSFELLKPSPAIVELGKSLKLQEERMNSLLKGIGIPEIAKQAGLALESMNISKQYYVPQMPRYDHDDIYNSILKASNKFPIHTLENENHKLQKALLSKLDVLIEEQRKSNQSIENKDTPHTRAITYNPKTNTLLIEGQKVDIKGKNQRAICNLLFGKTIKSYYLVTMEKMIKNLDGKDVFTMTKKLRGELADKYIRDTSSINVTINRELGIREFLIATREFIRVND